MTAQTTETTTKKKRPRHESAMEGAAIKARARVVAAIAEYAPLHRALSVFGLRAGDVTSELHACVTEALADHEDGS